MLGSTLKRSAATLAIVAGLLAAAVPAGAHVATAMQPNDALTAAKAPTTPEPAGKTMAEDSFTDVAWHQTVLEGLGARAAEADGTLVDSEGAKAPTKADAVVVLIGANDYGFATPQGLIMKDGNICDPIRHIGC
jgi:hypothetical protein